MLTRVCCIQYQSELKLLQDAAPIIASFILILLFSEPFPEDVCSLFSQLCDLLLAPFQDTTSPAFSSPPADSNLPFFPNLPMVRGTSVYAADKLSSSCSPDNVDSCRKYSFSHPTLMPGIFTIYCPKHSFKIFPTHFHQPSTVIIYDNSCKLCQLMHFRNTHFFVDRFHWRGHVGCSSGYSLDKYTTSDIITIYSQVNEQANAGQQKIKGQIACIHETWKFYVLCIVFFLSITNMDKIPIYI